MTRGELLRLFYELRYETTGKAPPLRYTRATGDAFDSYLEWCRARRINPEDFMRWRLEAAKISKYNLDIHRLKSEKHAKMWREWANEKAVIAKGQARIAASVRTTDEEREDLATVLATQHEQYRRNLLADGKAEECMRTPQYSGGYHPHSRFCPLCPMAVRCAAALNERHGRDLVALRLARPPRRKAQQAVAP